MCFVKDLERWHDQGHGCSARLYVLHPSLAIVLGWKMRWKVGTIPSGRRSWTEKHGSQIAAWTVLILRILARSRVSRSDVWEVTVEVAETSVLVPVVMLALYARSHSANR